MARSTDPLRRDQLAVAANLPTARVTAPVSNAALQLADALKDATPEARELAQGIAEDRAAEARAKAKRDSLLAAGQPLADATRAGVIKPTQNPWYVQAYNREAAALRAKDALSRLQVESQSWEEVDDHEAFTARWRQEVGALAEGYEGEDLTAGFAAAEGATSAQVLQTNIAKNAARIEQEREDNLGSLAVDALHTALRSRGGTLSPNEAFEALVPLRQQWFATGGDEAGWRRLVVGAVSTTAEAAGDKYLIDLLKAPELLHGPSDEGEAQRIGMGASSEAEYSGLEVRNLTPEEAAAAPEGAENRIVVEARRAPLALRLPTEGTVTSPFGPRRRPTAGASANHGGMDIAAPAGSPIKAQAAGKVIAVGRQAGLGNYITVDYGNGVVATYGHMSEATAAQGDIVSPGQVVGKVGRTGVATGNHVHYRLEVNGRPVNPETFNGQVGGSFEGTTQAPSQEPIYDGFPDGTRPYDPGERPANVALRGPSLYSMPGVSAQAEQTRYLIGQRAELAATERLRNEKAKRDEAAFALRDRLYQAYGTGLITGNVTRSEMLQRLGEWGAPAPIIAQTLNLVQQDLSDSVGVANAQAAASMQTPGVATALMDLTVKAATRGYSPGFEQEVAGLVIQGVISGQDGQQLVRSAVSRSQTLENEAEADQRRAEAENAGSEIDSAARVNEEAGNLAYYIVQQVNQRGGRLGEDDLDSLNAEMLATARAYLAQHPGDYEGAYQAAKAQSAKALRRRLGQVRAVRTDRGPTAARGSNPRRGE